MRPHALVRCADTHTSSCCDGVRSWCRASQGSTLACGCGVTSCPNAGSRSCPGRGRSVERHQTSPSSFWSRCLFAVTFAGWGTCCSQTRRWWCCESSTMVLTCCGTCRSMPCIGPHEKLASVPQRLPDCHKMTPGTSGAFQTGGGVEEEGTGKKATGASYPQPRKGWCGCQHQCPSCHHRCRQWGRKTDQHYHQHVQNCR